MKRDSARLDSILAGQKIDLAEVISWEGTNAITGEEVAKLLASLHKTNRIGNIDWTKQETKNVRLLNGTNEICRLSLGEVALGNLEHMVFAPVDNASVMRLANEVTLAEGGSSVPVCVFGSVARHC